jgi:pentatricopeptide repeat domain-containing protein 1
MSRLPSDRIAGWSSRWLTDELTSLARSGNWDAALETFVNVSAGGGNAMVSTNVYHYTTLISACARGGHWQPALDTFRHMRERGVAPNVKTYTSVIHACGAATRSDLASRAFALMASSGVHPNVHATTALVTAFSRSGAWDKAIAVVVDSEDDLASNPNVFTYTAAMDGCRRASQSGMAVAVLQRMLERGVEPNAVTLNTAIAACATTGKWDEAALAFTHMRGRGMKATEYTRGNLVKAFAGSPLDGMADDLLFLQRRASHASLDDGEAAVAEESAARATAGSEKDARTFTTSKDAADDIGFD